MLPLLVGYINSGKESETIPHTLYQLVAEIGLRSAFKIAGMTSLKKVWE
jgi:hypothetical protein